MNMKAFVAFTKKEFLESARTYRLLIIGAVFLLSGVMNPVTAKIMPQILSSFMPDGMTITIADPAAIDSWMQFYKNISTMLMLFIILYCGTVPTELSHGTLINMLTKGLSRKTVILSKFTSCVLIWTAAYLVCFGTTYGYTVYLLPGSLPNILFSAFCMWLYGVLFIALMLFSGVVTGNIYGSLLMTGGLAIVLTILGSLQKLQKYNPYLLTSGNVSLLNRSMEVSDFTVAIIITCILTILMLFLTLIKFDKNQI